VGKSNFIEYHGRRETWSKLDNHRGCFSTFL